MKSYGQGQQQTQHNLSDQIMRMDYQSHDQVLNQTDSSNFSINQHHQHQSGDFIVGKATQKYQHRHSQQQMLSGMAVGQDYQTSIMANSSNNNKGFIGRKISKLSTQGYNSVKSINIGNRASFARSEKRHEKGNASTQLINLSTEEALKQSNSLVYLEMSENHNTNSKNSILPHMTSQSPEEIQRKKLALSTLQGSKNASISLAQPHLQQNSNNIIIARQIPQKNASQKQQNGSPSPKRHQNMMPIVNNLQHMNTSNVNVTQFKKPLITTIQQKTHNVYDSYLKPKKQTKKHNLSMSPPPFISMQQHNPFNDLSQDPRLSYQTQFYDNDMAPSYQEPQLRQKQQLPRSLQSSTDGKKTSPNKSPRQYQPILKHKQKQQSQ